MDNKPIPPTEPCRGSILAGNFRKHHYPLTDKDLVSIWLSVPHEQDKLSRYRKLWELIDKKKAEYGQ